MAASRYQKQAMKDNLDRVSLVVPLRDEEGSVADLIRSLLAQTRPPDEVVLVDGGSTDAGPYYLGRGVAKTAAAAVERDLRILVP